MDPRAVVWLWMLLSSTCSGIKLEGNGYTDILVAISSAVPQDNRIIDKIKDMFTEGSSYLFEAMEKKVYFKDITILVPSHWNSTDFDKSRTESFEKARIRIDNPARGDDPYTNQYEDCGSESRYIHFTPNFLLDDSFNQIYGLRGKVLVHEWAHLRWGVYDEYNEDKPFYFSNGVQATSDTTRENLIKLLPTQADGSTNVCTGLNKALEVLKADNKDALGDEIFFLTDGEATDNINDCAPTAIQSGAIIHTLALGPSAAKELQEMADKTVIRTLRQSPARSEQVPRLFSIRFRQHKTTFDHMSRSKTLPSRGRALDREVAAAGRL
ncbi:Calcium-activated chloride channel regulator 2 [Triplophysa tibetana]|uniref:Calcium-activated chloride channel regulator 2 n=1 Tax=Triplophysa tibetana TaxID=1572043 RepID=A0A5A9N028_9TELE|nr:Calcium-activated chloride channel regulator 2 [Triplophysa tibetana]